MSEIKKIETNPLNHIKHIIAISSGKGEKHLVNRLIYQIKGPSRYDVIVFKSDDKNGNYYVKRVIGLPGEKVQIKNGRIYVNGKKTKAYSNQKILSAGLAADEITLKSKQYFVVGDNYNNSEDSRSASVGNIKNSIWQRQVNCLIKSK